MKNTANVHVEAFLLKRFAKGFYIYMYIFI